MVCVNFSKRLKNRKAYSLGNVSLFILSLFVYFSFKRKFQFKDRNFSELKSFTKSCRLLESGVSLGKIQNYVLKVKCIQCLLNRLHNSVCPVSNCVLIITNNNIGITSLITHLITKFKHIAQTKNKLLYCVHAFFLQTSQKKMLHLFKDFNNHDTKCCIF